LPPRRVNTERLPAHGFVIAVGEDTIANMRARVEQCRRLAATITDQRAAGILRQMADEGEQDIKRLLAEQESRRLQPVARGDEE